MLKPVPNAVEAKPEKDSKAIEFESVTLTRLSQIKSGAKTLQFSDVKKLIRTKLYGLNRKA